MLLYRVVWFYIFCYIGWKFATNITSLGSALSDFWSHGLYRNRNSDSKSPVEGESKAYLVAIGSAQQQYTFLYKPKSSVLSFGGIRRDTFERFLLNLDIRNISTVVYSDSMRTKVSRDIQQRNDDRWSVCQTARTKKYGSFRTDARSVRNKLRLDPFTIVFDIGDFSSDYLKATIPIFSRTCHQYIIYNKKRVLSNIHSIDLVMSYSGYRRIHSKSSRYFATYISSTYPLG